MNRLRLASTHVPTVSFGVAALLQAALAMPSYAAITTSGVVTPADPATWPGSTLVVGPSEYGSLTVTDGSDVVSNAGFIAGNAGGSGDVDITGAGSSWVNTTTLTVGNAGVGTLDILSGASVSNTTGTIGGGANGAGTVNVDASTWANSDGLIVGSSGTGALNISNGGSVTVAGANISTIGAAGSGTVNVDGDGSTLSAVAVRIGVAATGVLEVTGGADVSFSGAAEFARNANGSGTATISGAGSTFQAISMTVGRDGTGLFEVKSGAAATTGGVTIGLRSGSNGAATVDGAGSVWATTSTVTIGNAGTGTLTLTNGGKFTPGNNVTVGALGTVNVAGGVMDMAGKSITFATGADFNLTAGRLQHVTAFATAAAQHDLVQAGGTLAAGVSAADTTGIMTIHGNYALGNGGTLEVELAGAGGVAGVDFDRYVINGDALLEGLLDVQTLGGFIPEFEQAFDILIADTIDAANLTLAQPSLYDLEVITTGDGQTLRLIAVPEPASLVLAVFGLGLVSRRRSGV